MTATNGTAWALHTSGKDYRILLFDKYVVIGWGAVGQAHQFKTQVFSTTAAAQAFAIEKTEAKEKRGYIMYIEPRQHPHLTAEDFAWIGEYVDRRGKSSRLTALTDRVLAIKEMA